MRSPDRQPPERQAPDRPPQTQATAVVERVVRYYREATRDYRAWSRKLNMHFGYFRFGLNPLDLESMLDEMTRQVLAGLALAQGSTRIADLGCGVGASARLVCSEHTQTRVVGVTLLTEQVIEARRLADETGVGDRASFLAGDYTATPFPDEHFPGVYAIESACHAAGYEKRDFLIEALRILRSGGTLSMADGFIKGIHRMNPLLRWCYRKVTNNWAVEEFGEIELFTRALREVGFEQIEVRDISYRIAPSVAHIPFVTTRFLLGELFRHGLRLNRVRWGHIVACVLSPVVGMARTRFGYYLVTARKPGSPGSKSSNQSLQSAV